MKSFKELLSTQKASNITESIDDIVDKKAVKTVKSKMIQKFLKDGDLGTIKITLINGKTYTVDPLNIDGKGMNILGSNKMLSWSEIGDIIAGNKKGLGVVQKNLEEALKYFGGDVLQTVIEYGVGYENLFKLVNKEKGIKKTSDTIKSVSWDNIKIV